ncbi:methyl-accepting chemotaxis protein [Jonesiaceae bacterium BS-20]|uniref:Methyl-accepting chemotaxis protein n=1 Tax=Jonesiaceae bacterium BS-20 TaxID=3120821 RepID=A0AAU7DXA5_9MICO
MTSTIDEQRLAAPAPDYSSGSGPARPPVQPKASFINRAKIRTKLLLNSIVGAVTALAITGFALSTLNTVQSSTEDLERGITEVIHSFTSLTTDIWALRLDVALTFAEDSVEINTAKIAEIESEFLDVYSSFAAFKETYQIDLNSDLKGALEQYEDAVRNVFLPTVLTGDITAAEQTRADTVTPAAEELLVIVGSINEHTNTEAARIAADSGSAVQKAFVATIVIAGIGITLTVMLSMFIASRIRRNIGVLNDSIEALSQGDLTATPHVTTQDELGDMAEQLKIAQHSLREMLRGVTQTADAAVHKSEILSAASSQVAASSAETSAQAAVVATAAEQVSGNVQTVAAGAEQMSASIREIAQNAQEATAVAQTAATTADSTNITISRLDESSKEIGDVIKTITSIAEQTNLLALNATIEAARAGEAGKGFAVVASEVKDLAAESARAAEDVARRVKAIQSDTDSAIGAIGQISEIISTINNYQLTIASAVEEQTATTNEMSRSAAEAATGSSEIAANINGVAAVVEESTSAIAEMDRTIEQLSSQAQALNRDVRVFKF